MNTQQPPIVGVTLPYTNTIQKSLLYQRTDKQKHENELATGAN